MQKDQQKELGVSLKISNLFLGTYKINEKITDYTFTDKETVLSDSSTDTSFVTIQVLN